MTLRLSLLFALVLAVVAPAAEALTVRVITTATVGLQGNQEGTAAGWFDYDTDLGAIVDAEMTTVFTPPGNGSSKGKGQAKGHTRTYDEGFSEVLFPPDGSIVFRFFRNKGQQNKGSPDIEVGFGTAPGPDGDLGSLSLFSVAYPGGATTTPINLNGVTVMSSVEATEIPLPGSLPLGLMGLGAILLASRRRR